MNEFVVKNKLLVKKIKEDHCKEWSKKTKPLFLMRSLSFKIDNVIKSLWNNLNIENASLSAVGGYGRGELAPYSDIDLLITVENHQKIKEKISLFVSSLWDIGLEAGQSVRTINESIDLAKNDTTVATSLLELRFLCGNKNFFKKLKFERSKNINSVSFARSKILEMQLRHSHHHHTPYSLEPNVKESPGGIRDIQTIRWICLQFGLGKTFQELAKNNLLTSEEANQLSNNEKKLRAIRGFLHACAGRREDRLVFDLQNSVASSMGISGKKDRRASEILMQQYYRSAKIIVQITEMVLSNLEPKLFPNEKVYSNKNSKKIKIGKDFYEIRGLLEISKPELLPNNPKIILDAFILLQKINGLRGFTPETMRTIWNNRNLINKNFRLNTKNKELFLSIFKNKNFSTDTLVSMNKLGVLGRFLPVFRKIVGQMQHDLFHVYTVDQHIIQVIKNLERFTKEEHSHEFPLCSELMSNITSWKLYLAAFFHDIAKGRGGDHSILGEKEVIKFCKEFKLDIKTTKLLRFLVLEHLTMSQIAQKEDLDDPEVIKKFSKKVINSENLIYLYLFTVADIRGTSPKVWNNWKAKLLEKLLIKTIKFFNNVNNRNKKNIKISFLNNFIKPKDKGILDLENNDINMLKSVLNLSYFLKHDVDDINWHAKMIGKKLKSTKPIVFAKLDNEKIGLKVSIYNQDRKDLFSDIVAYFDAKSLNVLDAKINTTNHGYALNTFILDHTLFSVSDIDYLISKIEKELSKILNDKKDFKFISYKKKSRRSLNFPLLPRVKLTADEKKEFHILSITTGDSPGVLYKIAKTLAKNKISVKNAKISTLGEKVEDVFVVHGKRLHIESETIKLESDLLTALAN